MLLLWLRLLQSMELAGCYLWVLEAGVPSTAFHRSTLLLSTGDADVLPHQGWDRHREADGGVRHCGCHSELPALHKDRREVTRGGQG